MRILAPVLLAGLLIAPAMAQPVCEVSESAKIGDVMATAQAGKPVVVSWHIERREGVGEEGDHFARPSLTLDFSWSDGKLEGPTTTLVSISRYSDKDVGKAPPLSAVTVKATPAGGAAASWKANDPVNGEATFAKKLAATWPAAVTLDLIVAERAAASATFDLGGRAEAEQMAARVAAEAARKCAG